MTIALYAYILVCFLVPQALKIRIQALKIRIQALKIRIQALKIRILNNKKCMQVVPEKNTLSLHIEHYVRQSILRSGYTCDFFLAPATQRVKFHPFASARDKIARVSCPVRQRKCNLIPSAKISYYTITFSRHQPMKIEYLSSAGSLTS